MTDSVTISLGNMSGRAQALVNSGRFSSMSEIMCEGIKALDREEDELIAKLQILVDKALADPRPAIPIEEAFERIQNTPFPKK